jgi:hypothetical protein
LPNIFGKDGRNPFAIKEFLKTIDAEGLLNYDPPLRALAMES